MGLIHSPSIVSDGLVLALDAQNSRSYGGSGTTWTDISYRGNNGTLTNGPTFEPGGPFAGSTGGSIYFDGTGDYLRVASNAALGYGTGDFTIEGWFYLTGTTGQGVAQGEQGIIGSNTVMASRFTVRIQGNPKKMSWWLNGSSNNVVGTTSIQQNTWYHFALVRSGSSTNNVKLYLNGVLESQGTSTYDVPADDHVIGRVYTDLDSEYWNGYISNLRVVKGTALYTSAFTPPTKPLTPVSGTSLLTCQGGVIVDNSSNKFSITKNGDARAIQSASIKLDGTNDFGEVVRSNDFDFGTGNLTMESWVYITAYDAEATVLVYKTQSSGSAGNACGNSLDASGLLYMSASDNTTYQVNVSGGTVTLGRWHHICMTRSGSTWTCYLNATQVSTATWAGSVSHVTTGTFGGIGIGAYTSAYGGDAGRYSMNGNISNVRIYKGKALTASEVQRNFNALRNRFGI